MSNLVGLFMRTAFPILLASLLCVGACSPGVHVPRPNAAPSSPVPAAELSTIRVPVVVDLTALLSQVESMVPREIKATSDYTVVDRNALGDIGLRFEAVRDPLRIEMHGSRLTARARVRYWVEVAQRVTKPLIGGSFWQKIGSCGRGEALREVEVGLESNVTFNNGWQLASRTTLSTPTFTNQCRMTFLKVNVTDRVAAGFRQALERAATTVDQQIAKRGNLRASAERMWAQLSTPLALDSGFVLALNPTGAGIVGLEGTGNKLNATLGMTAQPNVFVGEATPRKVPMAALPASDLPDGLHVTVDGEISFDELNRQLARRLGGSSHRIDGHSIRIDTATAYGSGDQVVIQLVLSGDIAGTVYFVGTPEYNPKSGVVSLDKLDYSVETKDALLNVADWLYHEGFRSAIAEKARFSIERGMSGVRAMLERSLNRELARGVRMTASIGSVRPIGVYVTPTSLRARVVIDGKLRLEVQ